MTIEKAREISAQAWRHETTKMVPMIPVLAERFAVVLTEHVEIKSIPMLPDETIKKIMDRMGMLNSRSLYDALMQCQNEVHNHLITTKYGQVVNTETP